MRIGLVLANPPGYSETFFKNKILFLRDAGHDVFLYVDKASKSEFNYSAGFTLEKSFINRFLQSVKSGYLILKTARLSYSLFMKNRADGYSNKRNIISVLTSAHIMTKRVDWLHFGFATMAIGRENVASVIGAKMAVSIRGYDIAIFPIKHPNCYQLLWDRIDKLHYISDDLLNLALKNGFKKEVPHVKITPAIDTNLFTIYSTKKNEILRDELNTSTLVFSTVARLHWKKGLESTLVALGELKKYGVSFIFNIVGVGEEYERLLFAVHQLDLLQEVRFLGKRTQSEVRDILSVTDIYIQYSIQEGFGNSVLEAQAMGCLCIVSDAEGLGENVINNFTGYVVPKRNPKLLEEKILYAINNSIEVEVLKENAKKRVQVQFALGKQKKEFIDFYKN